MADHELRYRRTPGPIARLLGAVGIRSLVLSLGDQELDEPRPRVVWHTERSSGLRRLAVDLAAAGRDDADAVAVLARAAGRHTKELRRAAATIRAECPVDEDSDSNRAGRLLVAAATGRPVEPLTAGQRAWFRQVRELADLSPDEGFAVLAAEEPALIGLEAEVRDLATRPGPADPGARDGGRSETPVADMVSARLQDIAGCTSSPLVRTRAARDVAGAHLLAVAGQAPGDGPSPGGGQQA